MVHANCLTLVDVMFLGHHEQIRCERGITPESADTLKYVSRIQLEDLAVDDDLRASKFWTPGKFLINDFIEFRRRFVGQIERISDLVKERGKKSVISR